MFSTIRLLLPFTLLLCGSGCTTIAKRFCYEAKGAGSRAYTVPGAATDRFAEFHSVELLPPVTELGGLVPQSFTKALRFRLAQRLAQDEDAPFHGGEPSLTIEPRIYWYHKGGVGGIFPEKHAVVLFFLRAAGQEIGRVQVATKSQASRTDDDELAESMARELAEYFNRYLGKKPPKESDEEDEEEGDGEDEEDKPAPGSENSRPA